MKPRNAKWLSSEEKKEWEEIKSMKLNKKQTKEEKKFYSYQNPDYPNDPIIMETNPTTIEIYKMKKQKGVKESDIQKQCVLWFRLQYPKKLLFSIPNGAYLGGQNRFAMYAMLKNTGLTKGIPDLFLAEGNFYNGLFIEMKTPKGVLSDDQKEIKTKLMDADYKVVVCRSLEDFKKEIKNYVG